MDKQYVKLIVFDVFMAILIVVLYSPGLLALNPADPGILRPGLAIVCAIFIAIALVYVNFQTLVNGGKARYRKLDVEKPSIQATEGVLRKHASACKHASAFVIGDAARTGADELVSVQRKKDALYTVIAARFPQGSLTYDKFITVVDTAVATIIRNSTILANRIQTFDVSEYKQLEQLFATGEYRFDNIPDSIQEEKWQLYKKSTSDINAIINANERLLLELDKFAAEIATLDDNLSEVENLSAVKEVRELIEQTKYYE